MSLAGDDPLLARVVEHALGLRSDAIPEAARRATRTFLLDTLAVGIAGGALADRAQLLAVVARRSRADGDARLLGDGVRLAAADAALVNAYQIHNQEFDCVHEGAVVHPYAVIGGVMLALVERAGREGRPISGMALTDALVVGVDVAAGAGLAARAPMRFFRPAMAGALGALAAAGRLAGVDRDTLICAYGHLLGQLSGTLQAHVEGTPGLALQVGFNARAVIDALDLARAGIDAPRHALAGPFGYFALIEGEHDRDAFSDLGRVFRAPQLSHKPFPTGRAAHGALAGLAALDASEALEAKRIVAITLDAPPLIVRLVGRPAHAAMTAPYARLCLPYLVATWLDRRAIEFDDFDDAARSRPSRLAVAGKVTLRTNAVADPNALVPQRLGVRFDDGRIRTLDIPDVLGSPRAPLTRSAAIGKCMRCFDAAPVAFDDLRRARLIHAIDALDTLPDARRLLDLGAPTRT